MGSHGDDTLGQRGVGCLGRHCFNIDMSTAVSLLSWGPLRFFC